MSEDQNSSADDQIGTPIGNTQEQGQDQDDDANSNYDSNEDSIDVQDLADDSTIDIKQDSDNENENEDIGDDKSEEKHNVISNKVIIKRKPGRKRRPNNDYGETPLADTKIPSKKNPKIDSSKNKKFHLHLLEKRRLGRLKAAEEFAKKLKQSGIEKIETLTVNPTGLFQPAMLINQKNYSSDYLKKDSQIFAMRNRKEIRENAQTTTSLNNTPDFQEGRGEANQAAQDEDINLGDPSTTIVIHPGSKFLKIGYAQDPNPILIPSCVAVPKNQFLDTVSELNDNFNYSKDQSEKFDEYKNELLKSFKERMRFYKRKVQTNGHEQVLSFNKNSKPEDVTEKNDIEDVNRWINDPQKKYFGSDAIRCSKENFIIRYPFINGGSFNIEAPYYRTLSELLSEVCEFLVHILTSDTFQLKTSDFSSYKIVLVISDIFEKSHLEVMFRLLLNEMQFNAVAIIQESLATCYGAGVGSSTCVVNVGATQTRIACVDEGSIVEDSIVSLDYGGDDITKLFSILLLQSGFPYTDLNINAAHDWILAEKLKKDFVTFHDANVTVQLYNFIKRVPGQIPQKYEFETFEEVMLAPLSLFYPQVLKLLKSEQLAKYKNEQVKKQLPASRDIFTSELNDWKSIAQADCLNKNLYSETSDEISMLKRTLNIHLNLEEIRDEIDKEHEIPNSNYTSLEKAIIQSIANASASLDISKINSFYSNILLVGGGAKIPSLDFILEDRIKIWRPRLLSVNSFPTFYKKLTKLIKELPNYGKTNKTSEEEESLKKAIDELIKTEFEAYGPILEQQASNDSFFPVSILPSPRNMDPAELIWKGASVLAQIKLVEELFVTTADWDMHGSRILQHKCIFTY
ncbi:hypothetical protein TBLA_0A02530 [Henningerozyma blattae CBS 6284]|uniref:Uncharacterized protein n=1 Tax=Henningerozyma blattae (strain ATCC 34711 / CBS 6284 / DSM 70876 / NBRC 10599 / NRRL Y-10934 / UCD 77-7) TaxID=1071380 RepID=I2GVA0_HENB6|nr:hypothetical protein TBLA_0A02530 [Tetrapisispora blattae CBS 6284]CCH58052.1 hypothetical protein TBLA_0A02530 [Tetrapisispora blattae CBS 6284]